MKNTLKNKEKKFELTTLGFTLIELLAVIIILAVIALIATPIVLNVVDSTKRRANFLTAQGLLNAAHLYYVDSIMDERKKEKVDNIDNIYFEVKVQGNKPTEGNLYATNKGLTAIAIVIDEVCYMKRFDGELQETGETCNLGFIGVDNNKPTIEFSYSGKQGNNDWYISDTYITAEVVDNESGPSKLKWCMTDADCVPTEEINQTEVRPLINIDTIGKKICVIGYDIQLNESEKKCSEIVKVDKIAPEINSIDNVTVNKGENLDLRNGVMTTDSLSGISGEFSVNPSTIDTNIVGTTSIEYKVSDLAGNETVKIRIIEILGEAPSISFNSTGTFNLNGWSNADFYIKASITDHSEKGIKSSKWCITQRDSCTPITESITISALVSIESSTNKICVEAIDNNDKVTALCSNNYKLDTVSPSFNGISDIIIQKGNSIDLGNGITVSDTMSGIDGAFTMNPSSVDTSIAGTTNVTYSISDLAGNTQTITRKIIVDALAPSITFVPQGNTINSNGWSKSDFYAKVDLKDNSGLGIKEGKWCISQSNTCTPNAVISGTTLTPQITTESSNNRICIQATDNNDKQSQVICSDAYKLDKTVPIVGTANISGTMGSNSWYTGNVSITTNNGSDNLSGHSSTVSNVSSITSNTTGTTITITTTDLAGNTSTRNKTVKVDKNASTLTSVAGTFEITQGDSINTSTYFNNPSYSISGGSLSCSPSNTSDLAVGTQTITCTATGGNGLTTTSTKTITVKPKGTSLITLLKQQYNSTNTVGLLKDRSNYYYKGTNSEVTNNFVWYEGHLWRVIQINEDNTITMVTQHPITAIQPASSAWTTATEYDSSYVNLWLNNIFYNSISDKSKIKKNTFNVGISSNVLEIITSQYVGLLDETQYIRAGSRDSFLDIKDNFWFGNRQTISSARVRTVIYTGGLGSNSSTDSYGVRPVIKISDLAITNGDGIISNPFREDNISMNMGDVRVGEYISVPEGGEYCGNDSRCLFRVMGKDGDSVKVILNGLLSTKSKFGSTTTFSGSTINLKLTAFANSISSNYYYSGNKTFNIGAYPFVSDIGQNYTMITNQIYVGNVGLPVVGEMFSGNDIDIGGSNTFVNQDTIENIFISSGFWVMNAFDSSRVRIILDSGMLSREELTLTYGVRPTLFLNRELTFSKGDGTAENPYWLGN